MCRHRNHEVFAKQTISYTATDYISLVAAFIQPVKSRPDKLRNKDLQFTASLYSFVNYVRLSGHNIYMNISKIIDPKISRRAFLALTGIVSALMQSILNLPWLAFLSLRQWCIACQSAMKKAFRLDFLCFLYHIIFSAHFYAHYMENMSSAVLCLYTSCHFSVVRSDLVGVYSYVSSTEPFPAPATASQTPFV